MEENRFEKTKKVGKFLLFPYIEKFHKKYPNIEINISSRNTENLIKLLEDGDIDFVLDTSPINTEYSNLIIEPIMKLEHCFVKSKDYHIKNKNIKVEDLNKFNLILPVDRSTPRKPFMTIEATEMLIDAVKKNMGIGYVIKKGIEDELNRGEIEEIKLDISPPKLTLNLVYIENNLTYIPRVFMKEIKNKQ